MLGELPYEQLGITDGHNHAWISPVAGADAAAPVLNNYELIREELRLYRAAGGQSLMDCQPPGCGRDANRLAQLARDTGVQIIASTGFHRARYYAPGHALFSFSAEQAAGFFINELTRQLGESQGATSIRAGFIKVALERLWSDTPHQALLGAALAARQTGDLVEIHTEQGALAERVVLFFGAQGVPPQQLVLCHMDKRPDSGLHRELAQHGVLLEYDTFYRPKYDPEANLWPLLEKMIAAGLSDRVVLATDMAEPGQYLAAGRGPGLASLPAKIKPRLERMGIPETAIQQMLGGNIARRLAGLTP